MITNGLVLCLDAGNTKSYPNTGTTWTDLSGNSNTGTLTNGPTVNSYEARTNGNLYSNAVTNAYYTASFVTTGSSSETAPDGTTTASYFTLSATATTYKGVTGGYISYPTSSIVTISCFVKPTGGARYFWIREGSYGASRVGFDLTSVSVFSSSNATGYINAAGNGWYRVQAVMGALPQSSARVQLLGASDTTPPGNSNVSSTGTETYHIWGAQCELGEFATSPMLTTSSTVTRSAGPATLVFDGVNDYVSVADSTTTNTLSSITIEIVVKYTSTANQILAQKWNYGINAGYGIEIFNSNLYGYCIASGSSYPTVSISSYPANGIYYFTLTMSGGSQKLYANGVQVGSTAGGGVPSFGSYELRLGGRSNGGGGNDSKLTGNIYLLKLYNTALTAAEVLQNFNALRGRFGL